MDPLAGLTKSNGSSSKTWLVVGIGIVILMQVLSFVSSRVMGNVFSGEPQFTGAWKDDVNARLLKIEMAAQVMSGVDEAQSGRLNAIERKLDALLWNAKIDPDNLKGRP